MLIGDVWISPPMVGELTEQLGVHATTVRRWLRTATIPKASYLLLELFQNGSIARIHDAWSGWVIDSKAGHLIAPDGFKISAREILAITYRYLQLAALQCEVRELRRLAAKKVSRHEARHSRNRAALTIS